MGNERSEVILDFIKKNGVISTRDLFSFLLRFEPSLKYTTLKWCIYSLKEQGLIRNVGRGLYRLGGDLPAFEAPINRKILLINNFLEELFPYIRFSIWATQWLSDYMLHQPMSYITLVDVDPDASESVFNKLKDKWGNTKVLYKPTADEFDRYAVGRQNIVIVKDLISEAPIEQQDGVYVPTLEKIVVDIFAEKDIFSAFSGREISIIFNELDSIYSISRTKLLRYAKRRNAKDILNTLGIKPDLQNKEGMFDNR